MSIISISNLSKKYKLGNTHSSSIRDIVNRMFGIGGTESKSQDKEFWALKDINLEIQQGEVVGIIGKNGAGKSTLLKILSRITAPTTGKIQINGRIASLLEVGTGFHPELTGRENIFLNGSILGMTKKEIKSKFDEIVQFSEIEKFIDTPVKRYSSGMYVRLAFAVAAHLDPEILIVDEVLAVGDLEFQKKCLGKMKDVSETGKTVLFVSHNLPSIKSLTTKVVVLTRGELVFSGNTTEGLDFYNNKQKQLINKEGDLKNIERSFSNLSLALEIINANFTNDHIEQNENGPIEIDIQSNNEVKDFVVGISIFDNENHVIGSCFSPLLKAPNRNCNNKYTLVLPTKYLAPGTYCCAISLIDYRSGSKYIYDSISDILHFHISAGKVHERIWLQSWGSVIFPSITLVEE